MIQGLTERAEAQKRFGTFWHKGLSRSGSIIKAAATQHGQMPSRMQLKIMQTGPETGQPSKRLLSDSGEGSE